ncbi:cation diffusion facilitator family transporter [Klenkia marina]|uniref:Cation diffusion facilitator family transporter n=1 Tax=Klenkia marina TaxID=1960309 RepID=A0A1G4YEV6_9ACTN|nr:cation diffusion facilitator family transporter [Klenkia marina]SCX51894.1 cation diffusion facilitator family transporter [Klenkia marina]
MTQPPDRPSAPAPAATTEGDGQGSGQGSGHGGGGAAIIAALLANLGIAAAKFVAFLVTGASSMLAEAIHSVADSGNQVLLLVGGRTSRRRPTAEHPFGFGRDRYVYGFLVAVVLFSVGGLFAVYEGVHKVLEPEELTSPGWAFGVLGVAVVLESFSLRTAIRETNEVRQPGESYWAFIRQARAPELPVVLLEDSAALTGLVFALAGVGLTAATGNGVYDGLGTVAIGVLLVAVASVLAVETKSLLVGESATPAARRAIEDALAGGEHVESVIHLRTQHLGPEELLVAAKIAVRHDDTAEAVARAIDEAEARVRRAVPIATVIYLEPDIRRRSGSPTGAPMTEG